MRNGICYTKPLRVGQVLPVCRDSTLPFVWAHCLSCFSMTRVDTCHPALSGVLFCLPLAYAPVLLTCPASLLNAPSKAETLQPGPNLRFHYAL